MIEYPLKIDCNGKMRLIAYLLTNVELRSIHSFGYVKEMVLKF